MNKVSQVKPLQLSGTSIVARLTTRFCRAADESIFAFPPEEQLVIIDHFGALLLCIEQYHKAQEDKTLRAAIFQEYADKEQALLRKYGTLLQTFRSKKFNDYFDLDEIVSDYQIVTEEQYQAAIGDGQSLTQAGTPGFVWLVRNYIFGLRDQYLLSREQELPTPSNKLDVVAVTEQSTTQNSQKTSNTMSTSNEEMDKTEKLDKEATRARQLLAIYYFLLAQGIEGRGSHDIAPIVRLVHLLLGVEYDKSDRKGIYKKYLKMPNIKTDAFLRKDLEYIRSYFAELSMEKVVSLIDAEITRASKPSSASQRNSRKGS